MKELPRTIKKNATLNLAIGPSCFVQCAGCYNNFGKTAKRGGLVTRAEVLRLAQLAREVGFTQATLSGGDPLTHPEILEILSDLRELGMFIKLDSVGTALLRPAAEVFYGSPTKIHSHEVERVLGLVDVLGVPLDGSRSSIQRLFRREQDQARQSGEQETLFGDVVPVMSPQQNDVFADTLTILDLLRPPTLEVCVNTVVHAGNVLDVPVMAQVLLDHPPDVWQLFEYQATGAMGARNRQKFSLRGRVEVVTSMDGSPLDQLFKLEGRSFEDAVGAATRVVNGRFDVVGKSTQQRMDSYLLVNDAGDLWLSGTESRPTPKVVANVRDSDSELRTCLASFAGGARQAG